MSWKGKVQHAAGSSDTIDGAILPYVVASDAKLVDGKVVGDPTEGALLVLAHKAGLDIDATRERYPRVATLPFDPTYKLMAAFTRPPTNRGGTGALLRQGRRASRHESRRERACRPKTASPGTPISASAPRETSQRMEEDGLRVMAAGFRDLEPGRSIPRAICWSTSTPSRSPAWSGWSTRHARSQSRPSTTLRRRTSESAWSPGTT